VELVEVVLYVGDMERSIRFYGDTLGLELDFESAGWTTFRTGACSLALHLVDSRQPGTAEPDPTFLVPDAAAERAGLIAAGVEVSEIREPVAGIQVFDAWDPDGNRFSLESRIQALEQETDDHAAAGTGTGTPRPAAPSSEVWGS
jgi:catechol 2,3-dioxygenase-like lactoylglutathione lyase family enzyme